MKATFFNKPLEYQIELSGEKWVQGQTIQGKITLKNHGPKNVDVSNYQVFLGYGPIKKVKADGLKAMDRHFQHPLSKQAISSQTEVQTPLKFDLGPFSPISDKANTYFLMCGEQDNLQAAHSLQLQVVPLPLIEFILQILNQFYRFQLKELKNKKNRIDAKLIPPASKEFSHLEQLNLIFDQVDDSLNLQYDFKVKSLGLVAGEMKVEKKKQSLKQSFKISDVSLGESFDQGALQKILEETLAKVKKQF